MYIYKYKQGERLGVACLFKLSNKHIVIMCHDIRNVLVAGPGQSVMKKPNIND